MLDFRREVRSVSPAHFLKEGDATDAIDELHFHNVLQAEFNGVITLDMEAVCHADVPGAEVLAHYAGIVQLAELIE